MKSRFLLSIFVLSFVLIFSGCSSVEDAQLVADEFFEAYNKEDKKKMETLLDKESVIDKGLKDEFYGVFSTHWKGHGKVESYDRYAFDTQINNGVSTVTLKYKCTTEKGTTLYEKLGLVKRGSDYKIYLYEFNIDQSVIDKKD